MKGVEDESEMGRGGRGGGTVQKGNNWVNSLLSYHVDNGRAHDNNSTK